MAPTVAKGRDRPGVSSRAVSQPTRFSGLRSRLAWWGTAWLRGTVVADLAVDAIIGDDATHRVVGLTARRSPKGSPPPWAACAPRASSTSGSRGPPRVTLRASVGRESSTRRRWRRARPSSPAPHGLVPRREGAVVFWHVYDARPRPLDDVGEADRRLRQALLQTASDLAALDVARWRPEVADELIDLRRPPRVDAPPGTPPRCVELAARALQAAGIVELALDDDGGALSLGEAEQRRAALRDAGHSRPARARRGVLAGGLAAGLTASRRGLDRQLVAAGVGEVEPSPSRVVVGTLGDLPPAASTAAPLASRSSE